MFGQTKITVSNKGLIAIEGNKSYTPVGRTFLVDGFYIGRIKDGSNMYATSLDDSNSVEFKFSTKAEIKNFVKTQLAVQL